MESISMTKSTPSDANLEGYDYEFVSSTEKYDCPICLMCIRDPHLTECGHRFCNNCIRKWLRDDDHGKKCPSCNELLSVLQIYPDNFTKREILSLTVRCPFSKQGCSLTMELKKVETHKSSCDYELVSCPQGCEVNLMKKDVQSHILNECSQRSIECPHCGHTMSQDRLEGHIADCDLAPTRCQYCELEFLRHQISRHLQTDCPKALVKCLFHRFGCEELLPRTDIPQHNHQQTQFHLRLLALTVDSMLLSHPDLLPINGHDRDLLSSWSAGETAVPEADSVASAATAETPSPERQPAPPPPLRLHMPPPEQRLALVQPQLTPGSPATKAAAAAVANPETGAASSAFGDDSAAKAWRRRYQHHSQAPTSCSLHDDDEQLATPAALPPSQGRRPSLLPPGASLPPVAVPLPSAASLLPPPLPAASLTGSFDEAAVGLMPGGFSLATKGGLSMAFNGAGDQDLKKEKFAAAAGGECTGGGMSMADVSLQSASEAHRIRELEKESAMQRQYVFELKAKLTASEKTLQTTQSQLSDLEGRLCGGTYVWKLHNYSKLRLSGATSSSSGGSSSSSSGVLHSPGFYTSFYGYKFCLRVNVNGVESAQGTHLSLFVHLMQSENDDLLSWPFQGKITLSVLDQSEVTGTRNHIIETLQAKPNLAAFQRPTAPRNHKGFGYLEFAPFSYLESASFVKNDTLLIRAEVRPV